MASFQYSSYKRSMDPLAQTQKNTKGTGISANKKKTVHRGRKHEHTKKKLCTKVRLRKKIPKELI